jgi:hypothetical protein
MRTTPDELLLLLEERAPALRAAGVLDFDLSAEFDDVAVFRLRAHLAPVELESATGTTKNDAQPRVHPLDDPRTYGLEPGDPLPGLADRTPPDSDEDK